MLPCMQVRGLLPLFFCTASLWIFSPSHLAAEDDALASKPRFGIAASYYWNEQPYDVTSFTIAGLSPAATLMNESTTYSIRVDTWVLPFLNVYGTIGEVEGEATVDVDVPFSTQATVGYDGFLYGGGVIVAQKWGDYFAFSNLSYGITDMDDGTAVGTLNWRPRVGKKFGNLMLWTGMNYQESERSQSGTISGLPYQIDTEIQENWNYAVGGRYYFNENWSLRVEGGLGDRESLVVAFKHHF